MAYKHFTPSFIPVKANAAVTGLAEYSSVPDSSHTPSAERTRITRTGLHYACQTVNTAMDHTYQNYVAIAFLR